MSRCDWGIYNRKRWYMANDKIQSRTMASVAGGIAVAAGIAAAVLSILMIVNILQVRSVDPLHSEALKTLEARLETEPANASLRQEIRALDLLARKAYFTHQWQIRTGGYMLFAFILLFLIALKYRASLRPALPDLTSEESPDMSWMQKVIARKWLIYGSTVFFVMALIIGILSERYFEPGGKGTAGAQETAGTTDWEEINTQWPGFRGPGGIGVAYHTRVPVEWDGPSGQNIIWKVAVPRSGFSSPVIWNNKIFLSGGDAKVREVYCFAAESGDLLWTAECTDVPDSPSEKPQISEDTGYAAATMATNGTVVFAIFANGDIGAWDFEGSRVWARNLGLPDNHYGHSSSLVAYEDLVIIQYDQNTGGRLIALNAETGDFVYDVKRETEISWASPILVNTGTRDEVILNSNPSVISHDPATGEELWKVDCMMGEVAPSPAYAESMVYAVNEYAILVGIKTGRDTGIAWEFEDDLAEVSSPLAAGDFLFVAASWGTLSCFDRKSGERFWYHDFDDGFYASAIAAGENIYLIDVQGVMHVVKADREFTLVNSNALGERAVSTPAFMHDRIYIRGVRNLYCIGN
jgi:outer membrane protein assembly factor BamB